MFDYKFTINDIIIIKYTDSFVIKRGEKIWQLQIKMNI